MAEKEGKQELTAEELKDKYGVTTVIEAYGDRSYQVFLKKAEGRKVYSTVSRAMADGNLFDAAEIILQNCMVSEISDTAVLTDDAAIMSCMSACVGHIEVKAAEVKKL